jgi:hypothetical protein
MILTNRTAHLRTLGALILPLFLLGLLLDSLHQVQFEHEVCPVDGHVTHVDAGHPGDAHIHESSDPGLPDQGSGEEEHDHCGLPTLGLEGDVPGTYDGLVSAGPSDSYFASPHTPDVESQREALYRLAPKNSPPTLS